MEERNICGKIPLDLHERVRQEIDQTGSSTQKFIQKVIEEHFSKGEGSMGTRTLAIQVSEDFFQRVKEVVAKKGCKQKDFLYAVIEQAIIEAEAQYTQAEQPESEKA